MSTDTHARPVNVHEARRLLDEPSTLALDVRSPGEFETSRIHGAVNIPVDRLDSHLRDIVSAAGGTMVLVCQSGGRAEQAAGKLGPAGLEHLVVLEGGMNAWEAAGAPVERSETQRWSLERQVRLVAGSLVLGSVALSAAVPKAKWLAGGIGGGLTFAAVSNTCMMGNLLSKLPYNQGPGCDIDAALERLAAPEAVPGLASGAVSEAAS
jgi:rhodanese-related sulfurtransferase